MQLFKEFIQFIKKEKLDELVALKLKYVSSFQSDIVKYFKESNPDQSVSFLKENLLELLDSMEQGNILDFAEKHLQVCQKTLVEGMGITAFTISDVILLIEAERVCFNDLLPEFTQSTREAIQITSELERYFTEFSILVLNNLHLLHDEESQRLQEIEERYKDLFDNANDLIQILEPNGKIKYVNKAWLETMGYKLKEVEHLSIYDLIAEEEKSRFIAFREAIIAGDVHSGEIDTTLKSKIGDEVFVEGFIFCKLRDGKPAYTLSILKDITQRRLIEQKIEFYNQRLIEREENIRQLILNAPDAIILMDIESSIRLWNPKAEAIFGWTAEEAIGKRITDLIVPEIYREAHLAGMKHYKTTGEIRVMHHTIEVTALNKQGKEFYISITVSRTMQANEEMFIAFIRDITQQKENALELEQKKEQLERTNKELEQFAWLASHDIKEPVRKIRTFCGLMMRKQEEIPTELFQYAKRIQNSAERMYHLIEDLLSYSITSSGKNNYIYTNLSTVLHDVMMEMQPQLTAKNARVLHDPLPMAEVHPVQIRQLFQNLISNALKFGKREVPPQIEISATIFNGDSVKIEVRDNGIGFKKEYSEKIFQIFQRLLAREEVEGTGMGLAICKKIAENHNGTITAESEEGIGTVITVILPLHQNGTNIPGEAIT